MTVGTEAHVRWERLHPLSPVVRGGRGLSAVVALLLVNSAQGHGSGGRAAVDLGLVALVALLGTVNWLVTRWAFDGVTLRYETGFVRRDVRRLPVARIQAVDVVQPLLARLFGLAELRIQVAGTSNHTRLAYLGDDRANRVRAALLAAHHGQDPSVTPELTEVAGLTVPTSRLLGSVLLSGPTFLLVLLVVGLSVAGSQSPKAAAGVAAGGAAYLFALAAGLWRRFSFLYGFTVANAPDGVRIRRGLLGTVAETIPLRRIQAVRQTEPFFWRLFGWCRLEVDLAGVPGRDDNAGSRQLRKMLLPVGSLDVAAALRASVIGTVTVVPAPPPPRTRWKSPLSYHFLAAGHDDTMAVAVTGRVRKQTCWVPLEKVQSVRRVQGPVQRLLGLATVHLDAPGRRVEAEFRDRDATESWQLVDRLAVLSRLARRRALPDAPPPVSLHAATEPPRAPSTAPAGWHPDPTGRHAQRYWDGERWTEHVYDGGEHTGVDPFDSTGQVHA